MIIGHGIDVVDVNRICHIYKQNGDRFLKKILSNEEIEEKPVTESKIIKFLAKHWAVTEAVSKAVGCGLIAGSPLHFNDIVLGYTSLKKPIIKHTERLLSITMKMHNISLSDKEKITFHISTTDDMAIVIASAILEI